VKQTDIVINHQISISYSLSKIAIGFPSSCYLDLSFSLS